MSSKKNQEQRTRNRNNQSALGKATFSAQLDEGQRQKLLQCLTESQKPFMQAVKSVETLKGLKVGALNKLAQNSLKIHPQSAKNLANIIDNFEPKPTALAQQRPQ